MPDSRFWEKAHYLYCYRAPEQILVAPRPGSGNTKLKGFARFVQDFSVLTLMAANAW
jgi:hypothetical protein